MELIFHFAVWTIAVFYSLYSVYMFTKRINNVIKYSTEFSEGWLIDRPYDISDYEWSTWKKFAIALLPWTAVNFCGAEYLRLKPLFSSHYLYILVSFSFILHKFGFIPLLLFLSQPCIYFCIVKLGGKCKTVWSSSCLILLVINILKRIYENSDSFKTLGIQSLNHDDAYMVMITLSWIHLRCLSYSLELIFAINNQKHHSIIKQPSFSNLLSYTFYLPLLFLGPVILYSDFEKSFIVSYKSSLKRRLYCFTNNFTRYMGWLFFTELCLHFMYFNAQLYHVEIIHMMPDWSLYGGGLWMGLYFYLKYLVVYGMSGSWAALDHIEPEIPPRCIARVHRYSQMWKYFDVGLHKFLIKYIYKPAVEGIHKRNIVKLSAMRAFASLVCFTFVYFWHGAHDFILVWTILNYLGIVMESLATTISQSASYKKFKISLLKTSIMNDRFNAFLATPILIVSALSNFYFFAGYEIGNIYVQRVNSQSFSSFLVMFICLYSSCRVSQTLNSVNSRKIMT